MADVQVTKLRYGQATMGRRFEGVVEVHVDGDVSVVQVVDYIRKAVLTRQPPNPAQPLKVRHIYHPNGLPREL